MVGEQESAGSNGTGAGRLVFVDPTTLNIVTAGARPSLEKQPSPDDVSHQFTAGTAEAPAAEAACLSPQKGGAQEAGGLHECAASQII